MKVLAAMSGGVDSSVAAALLVRQGHDVTGVHLKLSEQLAPIDGRVHGCCGLADAEDARRVAQVLDIPFYVWNLAEQFGEGVVENFVAEYAAGRTPNPCVRCNETIKFGALLERAITLGFDAIATGHYAINVFEEDRWRLRRSADAAKDQSYVLARCGQRELARALFPVGEMTKDRTRDLARELSLRVADKPDSYEICFVADGDAASFVEQRAGRRPGEMVDHTGAVVGSHAGVHRFTIGQRRGLGLGIEEPRYVLALEPEANRVVVGPRELLARGGLEALDVRWTGGKPEAFDAVQVRAHGRPVSATLAGHGAGRASVRFTEPQRGIAPGQLVAFYAGDEVVGGGTIERSAA